MAAEVTQWRQLIVTWLKTVTALTAVVSSRIYWAWPQSEPAPPFLTLGLSRQRAGDYPAHAWAGALAVNLYADDANDLDTMEDAILDALRDRATAILTSLSSTAVRTHHVLLSSVSADVAIPDWHATGAVLYMRTLSFAVTFTPYAAVS